MYAVRQWTKWKEINRERETEKDGRKLIFLEHSNRGEPFKTVYVFILDTYVRMYVM